MVSLSHPQLPLGLVLKDSARFENFYAGQNREAVRSVQSSAEGVGESLVYLAGQAGLGKTHLLQAACHQAARSQRATAYLPLGELLQLSPALFDGLEQMDLVCLDDVGVIAGRPDWESGLFNLFNRMRDKAATLLVAAGKRPAQAGFVLADLASRLGWGVTYVLKPLDDEAVLIALTRRAKGRGLELPEDTARFLLRRFPRNLPSLFALFDTLDTASFIEQRRLTIPFVKAVLEASPY